MIDANGKRCISPAMHVRIQETLDAITETRVARTLGPWRYVLTPEPEIHPCRVCGEVLTLDPSAPCGACRGRLRESRP
jgi:hypothetical protein